MTTPLITRLKEAADMKCPKCNARSGDDWDSAKVRARCPALRILKANHKDKP